MSKLKPYTVGLLQSLGAAAYCALISGFFWGARNFEATKPQFIVSLFMLFLLVFSATVTGSIVFGYPAYLAVNQRIKEALSILAYTLVYSFIIILIIAVIIILM